MKTSKARRIPRILRATARLIAMMAAIALLLSAGAAAPPVSRVTMTVFGQDSLSRGFTWHTDAKLAGSDLQIMPADGAAQMPIKISGRSGTGAGGEIWHKAEVRGLVTGTRYIYRVGDESKGVWSPWAEFETPAAGGFTFICLTDTQAASARDANISANTLAVAMRLEPEAGLLIHSGDVVDKGSDESLWQITLDAAQSELMSIAIAPAAGNHESANGDFFRHFNLDVPAGSATQTGAYFSFDWGPVHFATLNTNEPSGSIAGLSDRQLEWLRQDIAAARENGAKRVVVNLHKGMYSLGPYTADSTNTGKNGRRTKLAPVFAELGVDLVLQGHDHVASRTYPLDGVTYINTRTAGVKAYPVSRDATAEYLSNFEYIGQTPATYTRYQNFAIIRVDFLGNMSGDIYEIDSATDPATAYIVDSFYLPAPRDDSRDSEYSGFYSLSRVIAPFLMRHKAVKP